MSGCSTKSTVPDGRSRRAVPADQARDRRRDRPRRGDRPVHQGRGLPAVRGRVRRLVRSRPRRRSGQRHRRPDPRPEGVRRRPRGRGRHRLQHLHRHRRGHPPERRPAGVRRRGPRHLHHGPRAARGGHHAADQADPARAPVRPPGGHGADHGHRRASRHPRAGGRGAGPRSRDRRPARGRPGPRGVLQLLPGQEPGRLRRRGDGGLRTTRDFIDRVRQLANHGAGTNKYDNVVAGTNSRLDTLQAAVLRVKLASLDQWNRERRERVDAYTRALAGAPVGDAAHRGARG